MKNSLGVHGLTDPSFGRGREGRKECSTSFRAHPLIAREPIKVRNWEGGESAVPKAHGCEFLTHDLPQPQGLGKKVLPRAQLEADPLM